MVFSWTKWQIKLKSKKVKVIPIAIKPLSFQTIGIREIQTADFRLKAQIHRAPPTAWAVKVVPKARAKVKFSEKIHSHWD